MCNSTKNSPINPSAVDTDNKVNFFLSAILVTFLNPVFSFGQLAVQFTCGMSFRGHARSREYENGESRFSLPPPKVRHAT